MTKNFSYLEEDFDFIQTSLKINQDILLKIEQSISILKNKNKKTNKQRWVLLAIQEKLQKSKEHNVEKKAPTIKQKKTLSFVLTNKLSQDLERDVTLYKSEDESYTKKRWILEAIQEKLEREEVRP